MSDLDTDTIRAALAAATPGPYRWIGNTDNDEVRLIGLGRRKAADGRDLGRGDVLAVIRRERTADSPGARGYAEYIGDCGQIHDPTLNKGKGGYRQPTDDEVKERVRDEWLEDQFGQPMHDNALTVFNPERGAHEFALDLAVYEVARNQGLPDDTPRSHPKIYRADIVDVRNGNARFLRDSWAFVDHLLGEVDRLTAERDSAIVANHGVGREREEARAERDRYRAALEAARTAMHSTESGWEDDPRGAIYRARLDVELALAPGDPIVEAAIARAEALKAEADA